MSRVFCNISETVGNTPLVELSRFARHEGLSCRILGKLESSNPTFSVKDRIAIAMIRDAEKQGLLHPGDRIVSASSGNTGIALAAASAALGYKITIVMPASMSRERVALLSILGAEVQLTKGTLMSAAVELADSIVDSDPAAVRLKQFENPANPDAHYATTAREIWGDTDGEIDAFVAGVGTGGTLTGVARFLKEKRTDIRVVAVEPETCAVLSGGEPGAHFIQGIGAGFIPPVLDRSVFDEVITVTDRVATEIALTVARTEGALVGISAGANLAAAVVLGMRPEMRGKTIVTILCDTGERYLSTPLAEEAVTRA